MHAHNFCTLTLKHIDYWLLVLEYFNIEGDIILKNIDLGKVWQILAALLEISFWIAKFVMRSLHVAKILFLYFSLLVRVLQ